MRLVTRGFRVLSVLAIASLATTTIHAGEASPAGGGPGTIVILADLPARSQRAGASSVRFSGQLRPVAGVERRERTITMHNWYQPIAAAGREALRSDLRSVGLLPE